MSHILKSLKAEILYLPQNFWILTVTSLRLSLVAGVYIAVVNMTWVVQSY
jgi:hypothetical protein